MHEVDGLFTSEEILGLSYLAEGNPRLVEDALVYNLKHKREVWWKFWTKRKWSIDKMAVIKYIQDHRYDEHDNALVSNINIL